MYQYTYSIVVGHCRKPGNTELKDYLNPKYITNMKVIKKDFVDENTISFCGNGRKLSSGTAYFMQKPNGKIVLGGKQCAQENSTTDLNQIPNFTKSLIARREGSTNSGSKKASESSQRNLNKSKALTYMLLREEKLTRFKYYKKSLSYDDLRTYYESYKETYDLSEKAISHILNIEKKVSGKRISLKNLSTCYAYEYILARTLVVLENKNNTDGIEYVKSLREDLYKYCNLTSSQIEGLAKWLKYLPKDLAEAKLERFYNEK